MFNIVEAQEMGDRISGTQVQKDARELGDLCVEKLSKRKREELTSAMEK